MSCSGAPAGEIGLNDYSRLASLDLLHRCTALDERGINRTYVAAAEVKLARLLRRTVAAGTTP